MPAGVARSTNNPSFVGGRWHSLLSCAGKIVNYDFAHDVSARAIKGFSSGKVAHSVFFQGYVGRIDENETNLYPYSLPFSLRRLCGIGGGDKGPCWDETKRKSPIYKRHFRLFQTLLFWA